MKTFKQLIENIIVLDEAVMDQKMWDQTKKGDKLTINFDSGIKKGNKATFVVGTKNIVGKARVGKITMKREDGKGGKFFLYNRNGNISLALGDMAASMTGIVKESVEVQLDEIKQGWALIDTADGNKVKALSSREQGVKQSRTSAERPPMSVKDKNTLKIVKLKKAVGDKEASFMIGSPLKEEVELDERNYAKEYAN